MPKKPDTYREVNETPPPQSPTDWRVPLCQLLTEAVGLVKDLRQYVAEERQRNSR